MNEKMYKARSPEGDDNHWPTYKGFGVTTKWTLAYIDQRLRMQKLAKLMLKNF